MKLVNLLILTLFLTVTNSIYAQESEKTPKLKNDISLNLSGILPNIPWSADFLLRKASKKRMDKKIQGAKRFGVSTAVKGVYVPDNLGNSYINLTFVVGHEWQANFNKFQLFYGLDTKLSSSLFSVTDTRRRREALKLDFGPEFFLGMKYFLHPRFFVSLESALFLRFGWSSNSGRHQFDLRHGNTPISALRIGHMF